MSTQPPASSEPREDPGAGDPHAGREGALQEMIRTARRVTLMGGTTTGVQA
ncbi:hypothetical protein [Arthrobacter caoxuetaonis]|uniref:Uncharacterized protein n=1 Tax=Arthrobacter caoxuetaonis TaxID=2886935 RepID=A0A9X1MI51_9MICC|nr:hypothetical protein [Arthrobacter caoxuetaonis]MCC3299347.1 hypothetical protein [Arthrobacter caoxuetaonis]USQ59160.1 hypothetical protein NF551_18815 [Arthrobacter caoxuetaonis]